MCIYMWLYWHYGDVIIGAIASQITSLTIVYSTVYSDADQRKHQSSTSLAFVRGIHRGPRVTALCKGNGFPSQRTSNAEKLFMSRSRHELTISMLSNPRAMMEAILLNFFEQLQLMMTSLNGMIFPRYWPFALGFHRSPVNSHHKASEAELWSFLWSAPE